MEWTNHYLAEKNPKRLLDNQEAYWSNNQWVYRTVFGRVTDETLLKKFEERKEEIYKVLKSHCSSYAVTFGLLKHSDDIVRPTVEISASPADGYEHLIEDILKDTGISYILSYGVSRRY